MFATQPSLLDRLEAPARVSDTERLYRRLKAAREPISMLTLRHEFPGCLTQRTSDLRARGLVIDVITTRVKGKTWSTYELVTRGGGQPDINVALPHQRSEPASASVSYTKEQ